MTAQAPANALPMESELPRRQTWTLDGYPIVDDKYLDLSTGRIEKVQDNQEVTPGPPALEVYWHNRMLTGREDQFFGVVTSSWVDVTEYLRRVGRLLDGHKYEVLALNATKYAVNVIIAADCSNEEMMASLNAHKLLRAS